jgi:hypothetical protein
MLMKQVKTNDRGRSYPVGRFVKMRVSTFANANSYILNGKKTICVALKIKLITCKYRSIKITKIGMKLNET